MSNDNPNPTVEITIMVRTTLEGMKELLPAAKADADELKKARASLAEYDALNPQINAYLDERAAQTQATPTDSVPADGQ